jgi:hypothetical protein
MSNPTDTIHNSHRTVRLFRPCRPHEIFRPSREAIILTEEELPKRYRRNVILDQTMESVMWIIINMLYREYCRARLQEMRRLTLSH